MEFLRYQTVGARKGPESRSPLSREEDCSQSLSAHIPNPGLCLHHVPSLSSRKWGTLKISEQGRGTIHHTCAFGHGHGSAFYWEPGSGAAKPGARKPLPPLLLSISLLPPGDTLLSLPCSVFSSPSILAFPSAPPAACQLPADDISFHVWG